MGLKQTIHKALTGVVRRLAIPAYVRKHRRFERLLLKGRDAQRELLLRWVQRCRDTKFGRDHHFDRIQTVEDFRREVTVARYDYFAPYIDAVARGELNALFPPEERVERFTITTGSTGTPKLNPVTPTWLKTYRRAWNLWGSKMLADHPEKIGGKILQVIGSWNMGRTPAGTPISMVSALLARNQPRLVRPFYSVPMEVTDIKDPVSRYYTTLRLGIPDRIGLVVLMNPGNLLRLVQLGDEHRDSLIRDIRDGTLSESFEIPREIREKLSPRLHRPNPNRARELEQIVERTGKLYPKDYWPEPIIACWLGGTAGYQARYLRDYFGSSPLRDQGLVSSEGRHTIPLEDDKPQGVLSITTGFYEFVPVAEVDSPQAVVLEGHELEIDSDYYLVITTFSGYFRFNLGDVVRCRGHIGETPVLEFLQKGDRCGDLEGEKVTESQFIEAASEAARELAIQLGNVTAVPCRSNHDRPCYFIVVEHGDIPDHKRACEFLQKVDGRLIASNFLYSARRREGVLGTPRLLRIPTGGWHAYMQAEIDRRGTGETHYKHPGLVQNSDWLHQFQAVDTVQLP